MYKVRLDISIINDSVMTFGKNLTLMQAILNHKDVKGYPLYNDFWSVNKIC